MKTTLNIDEKVLRNAKAQAARAGITLTKLVEDALRAKLMEAERTETYRFEPSVVTGNRAPNVDISERDALYDVIDNA